MFVVRNRIGDYDDKAEWTELVSAGKLAAYFENKQQHPQRNTFGYPHFTTYVVKDYGWDNPNIRVQKATPITSDPEALFQKPGDEVEFAVLPDQRSVDTDFLHMTITLVEDTALANAIARTTSTLDNTGWCDLELKLLPEQA